MLSTYELTEIDTYLTYLARGINDNGLSEEQNNRIIELCERCSQTVNELNNSVEIQEKIYQAYEEIYNQEEKDIDRMINTLKKYKKELPNE